MIEIMFGPDGVGKSTLAQARLAEAAQEDRPLVLLHGTNFSQWYTDHPKLMDEYGFAQSELPTDDDFVGKAEVLLWTARALTAAGKHLLIDGHTVHKTYIRSIAGARDDLHTADMNLRIGQLAEAGVLHTHVVLDRELELLEPGNDLMSEAIELQRRIRQRGDLSPWDPQTVQASADQLLGAYTLESTLKKWGAAVMRDCASL